MASTGGNLLQRTRCFYFYDTATPCNKREPGSGCSAIDGINRINAILGTSEACIATHPSDMCVALAALDATVHVAGPRGRARDPVRRLPSPAGRHAAASTPISRRPRSSRRSSCRREGFAANYSYLKIRDRLSYAFALVSVAAALEIEGGRITEARLALGGVAHKPWRKAAAEAALRGEAADRAGIRESGRHPPARRQRLRAQRLQDRLGAPRHRTRLDAGRERHAAVAIQQEDPVSAMAALCRHRHVPRRRPRQGHRRGEICRRVQRPGPRPWQRRHSTIAKGRIARIDTSEALARRGVIDVLTHENRPRMAGANDALQGRCGPRRGAFRPLYDDRILFNGQPIALVVAEELGDRAIRGVAGPRGIRSGSARDRPVSPARCDAFAVEAPANPAENPFAPPKPRGDAEKALAAAEVRHEGEYYVPIEHHNPMELFASTVDVRAGRQAHDLRQDARACRTSSAMSAACSRWSRTRCA